MRKHMEKVALYGECEVGDTYLMSFSSALLRLPLAGGRSEGSSEMGYCCYHSIQVSNRELEN